MTHYASEHTRQQFVSVSADAVLSCQRIAGLKKEIMVSHASKIAQKSSWSQSDPEPSVSFLLYYVVGIPVKEWSRM
jgi:hypothetical protein